MTIKLTILAALIAVNIVGIILLVRSLVKNLRESLDEVDFASTDND